MTELVDNMARNFAAEWLRPSDPDHADPTLLDTLSTVMVAFYAATSQAVERRALASASASPGSGEGWQPIETFPRGLRDALFWVVPKTPEESYINTSGDPIFGTFKPYMMRGGYGQWNSLSKALLWHRLPSDPSALPASEGQEPPALDTRVHIEPRKVMAYTPVVTPVKAQPRTASLDEETPARD